MNKLLENKWIKAIYGNQYEWITRVFRFLLQQAVLGSTFYIFYFAAKGKFLNMCLMIAALIVSIVLFYFSFKLKNLQNIYFLSLFITNIFVFPAAYLTGKGYQGIIPLWLLVFIVVPFVFLDGWRLYLVVTCSIAADLSVFIFSIVHPEHFTIAVNISHYIVSLCVNIPLIGATLGVIIKFQIDKLAEEKKLAEARGKEIEEISNSKSMFFANMSHEIRTPINTIIGLNEMILRDTSSDEVAENAVNVQNASKTLLALINDILDMSKMESGKMEIVSAQYETASMLSDIVNIIWSRANSKGLDFKIDVAENIPSMLFGDEIRIKQVLTNILTNAVKYTEKGSVTLTATGEKTDDNNIRLRFSVEDTGIGIKKDSIEELFTVFKRVDAQKTKKIEGTGLGLSISKQLVEMMGGNIQVDSIYGKGSTFTVTIDQQVVDGRPLGAFKYASGRKAKDREKYDRSFEAPDARILVVDDNEMNLTVVKKLLRDTKVQIDLAASGKECLDKTLHNNYNVILMDHLMPEMDGEETLKILRTRQEGFCQKAPVIALTANVMTNAQQIYQNMGFDSYLAKPIAGTLLEATLLKFLPDELIEYNAYEAEDEDTPEYSVTSFTRKKKKIAICTECTCDLPDEWIREKGIKLMYYYITTQEGRFIDTKEIFTKNLMEYLLSGRIAESHVASLREYELFMADRLAEAEHVIFITIAKEINSSSDGYQLALDAAKNFDNVSVINSGHLSSGLGLLTLIAAEMAAEGVEAKEIISCLEKIKNNISTSFIIDNIDSMYKNGRITKGTADISRIFRMHPVLVMKKDKMTLAGFMIGKWETAAKSYIRRCLFLGRRTIDKKLLFVTYVGLNAAQLEMIQKEIEKYMQFDTIRFQEASATISSNSGVGTFGLIYKKV